MRKDMVSAFGVLSFMAILVTLILGLIYMLESKSQHVEIDCALHDIEYVDIGNQVCWIDGVSSTFCPLPKSVRCRVVGEIPIGVFDLPGG